MMGSVERGVSIYFTTLPVFVRQVRVSQRDRLAHRLHGTIRASPFQAKASVPVACRFGPPWARPPARQAAFQS